jgi:hypothetical protein
MRRFRSAWAGWRRNSFDRPPREARLEIGVSFQKSEPGGGLEDVFGDRPGIHLRQSQHAVRGRREAGHVDEDFIDDVQQHQLRLLRVEVDRVFAADVVDLQNAAPAVRDHQHPAGCPAVIAAGRGSDQRKREAEVRAGPHLSDLPSPVSRQLTFPPGRRARLALDRLEAIAFGARRGRTICIPSRPHAGYGRQSSSACQMSAPLSNDLGQNLKLGARERNKSIALQATGFGPDSDVERSHFEN